ncbi:MAG: glycosyltransferase family 2 protein [Patescibacteria group bacterium]|nr:glycosyltransferase family 2 protein [Patescibacteria group bacterium]
MAALKNNKMNQLVSIILTNHNGKKWLKNCLDSLYAQTYKNFEIILVDNASDDDSIDFIKKNYKDMTVIQNDKDLGFGTANNIGVKNSKGDILFLLNNDTRSPSDLLEKLIDFKNKNDFDLIGPQASGKNKIDLSKKQYPGMDFLGYPISVPYRKLFYIDGCALMIDKKKFIKLGGFDEKYYMYSEDTDLSWRAHLFGMRLAICHNAHLFHFGGGSSERTRYKKNKRHIIPTFRRYEVNKNNLRNLLKNYRLINLFWIIPLSISQDILESLFYFVSGNFKMFIIVWRAIFWNIINIQDTIKQRKIIQRRRKVGDLKILSIMNWNSGKLKTFLMIGVPKFK